jgi:archaetidylinositol phosphate synthase
MKVTAKSAKERPRSEVIMRLIQPLASVGVRYLAKWQVNPLWVVLTHALLGFTAAILLAQETPNLLWLCALLLQLKTLLDNMDGGLARATGQVTQMGRYLDTGMDFFVNIALFIALSFYGSPLLSLLALILLTLILSLDFNAERLYKQVHLAPRTELESPIGAPLPIYRFFKGIYTFLFAPQDKLIEGFDRWLFNRVTHCDYKQVPEDARQTWSDLFSTATLVNLGLSTQLLMLSVCLVMGHPYWYVYSIFLQAVYALVIQLLRAIRFRRYMRQHQHFA